MLVTLASTMASAVNKDITLVVSLALTLLSLILLFGVTSSTDPQIKTVRKGDDGLYETILRRTSGRNLGAINKRDIVGQWVILNNACITQTGIILI